MATLGAFTHCPPIAREFLLDIVAIGALRVVPSPSDVVCMRMSACLQTLREKRDADITEGQPPDDGVAEAKADDDAPSQPTTVSRTLSLAELLGLALSHRLFQRDDSGEGVPDSSARRRALVWMLKHHRRATVGAHTGSVLDAKSEVCGCASATESRSA